MRTAPRPTFPEGSLLSAMVGEHAPMDVRRAARRLRSEGAPAVAVDDEIAALARGLGTSDVSRSPAVLDVLPPLFWIEARRENDAGSVGWVAEKKGASLSIRGFEVASDPTAVPELRGAATLAFGAGIQEEDEEIRYARGLIAAIALPEVLAGMGEASPVLVLPADPSAGDAGILRGIRLSVALPPDAAPN
ncbi:hypothetical protein VQH23_13685 [Pararoseomonas sp. SCSIO 73927]|uniref:hypothetical protein n=1 Tax=Pararoseomonas sp. SCSIO 73927 TaxID=3114537 RepID=UPI0030D076BF